MLKSMLMIPAAFLSALLPGTAMAQAQAPGDIHVAYRDLNLQSPAGVKQLDRRIRRAISVICPDFRNSSILRDRMVSRCREEKQIEVAGQRAEALAKAAHRDVELAAMRPVR